MSALGWGRRFLLCQPRHFGVLYEINPWMEHGVAVDVDADDEALVFCANSVVAGDVIHMPTCPPRVGRQLEAWGFHVVVCPVDEFLKSGGGCRCLTFALDVELSDGPG